MADGPGRSYDPDHMQGGLDGEIERLEAQSRLAWPQEARILARLGLTEARRVLDIGCGAGAPLDRMARAAPHAALIGIEPDDRLRERAAARLPGARLLPGTAEALPLPDAGVDFAVARYLFQHVADPGVVAREARRVLAPGGRLAAIEVDGELWGFVSPRFAEAQAAHEKAWRAQRDRGGDRMIGRRLWRILAAAGFTDLSLELFAYHSDDLGVDAFAPLIDPSGLLPLVEQGVVGMVDYARAVHGYERFRADPDALVLLAGMVVSGRAPVGPV
jgi:ubiquinone/menaquinone biosynthesis C-methylase UbiE